MAKAFLCLLVLAASLSGAAAASAACVPVNALTFEPEPDCTARIPPAPVPVVPAAIAAPASIIAPEPQVATATATEKVQPAPAAPASEAADGGASSRLYRVQRNLSDGFLALRSGPGGQHDMIVRIPAGTEGLSVADCPRSNDGSRLWCRVSWKGKSGWVFSRFIAQQN